MLSLSQPPDDNHTSDEYTLCPSSLDPLFDAAEDNRPTRSQPIGRSLIIMIFFYFSLSTRITPRNETMCSVVFVRATKVTQLFPN